MAAACGRQPAITELATRRTLMPKMTLYYVDHLEADRDQRFAAFQGQALPPSLYERVASYTLDDDVEDPVALEDAFRRFNIGDRCGLKCRSLSVGDLVQVNDDDGSRLYRCQNVGWERDDTLLDDLN